MTPQIFGYQHLIYLLVTTAMAVGIIILVKKKYNSDKSLRKVALISGIIMLACIMTNRISLVVYRDDYSQLIPSTFCSFVSVFYALTLILGKKDNSALQFIAFTAVITGTMSNIYPDYIGQDNNFFYLPTITGLLHHSMQTFCSILVLSTGYLKLRMSRWTCLPIGFAFFMTYGVFLSDALGKTNAMQLYKPLIENTIFTWYFVGAIIIVVYTITLLIIDWKIMPPEQRFFVKFKIWFKSILNKATSNS